MCTCAFVFTYLSNCLFVSLREKESAKKKRLDFGGFQSDPAPACLGSSLDQPKIWVLMRRRTDLGWRYMTGMWSTWSEWELMDGWMEGTAEPHSLLYIFFFNICVCGMWNKDPGVLLLLLLEVNTTIMIQISSRNYLLISSKILDASGFCFSKSDSSDLSSETCPVRQVEWGWMLGPHIPTTCVFCVSVWTSCIFILSPWRPGTDLNKFEKMHAKVPKNW